MQGKKLKKVEAERIRQQAIINRKSALLGLGMIYDEFTKSYLFNQIAVTANEIETLTKDEFTTLFVKTEGEIKVLSKLKGKEGGRSRPKEVVDTQKPVENWNYTVATCRKNQLKKPIEPVTAPILTAPVTVEPEKLLLVEFQVTASRAKLELLKQFLITNEITYKNI